MSEMLRQVAQAKDEAKLTAATGEGGNPDGQAEELPEGSSPLEAREAAAEIESEAGEEPTVEATPEKTIIRIGGQTFETEAEAEAYVEQLERDKLAAESRAEGLREGYESARGGASAVSEVPEEDLEQEFYANPKGTLQKIQHRAVADAEARIDAKLHRESMWNTFLSENPDVRRKDAERILQENFALFDKMTDVPKAMKLLAQKTRAEYEEIRNLGKPRTELKSGSPQVVSPGSVSARGVTPKKNNDAPLSMAEQLRKLRGH